MKKTVLMIVVALLIAGVSGGGVYLWQNNKVNLEKQALQNQITELQKKNQTTNNAASNSLQTSLKTYTSSKYGFSFQYPNNYLVEELTDSVKVLSQATKTNEDSQLAECKKARDQGKADSSCGIYDALYVDGLVISKDGNPAKLSLDNWIVKNLPSIYSQKPLEVNGFAASEVVQMGLDGTSIVATDANANIYRFQKFSSEDPVFDQVINSFKTTK